MDLVRVRGEGDLAACVAALRVVYETDGYPGRWPADPAGWLTPRNMISAWVAGAATGHVVLVRTAAGAEISRLFVTPPARQRGLGRVLLAHARREAGDLPVTLEVVDTAAAVTFYERTGWTHTGTTTATWTTPAGTPVHLRHYTPPAASDS